MLEAILFFAAGYFVSASLRHRPSADRILYWDKDCLGWRPVTHLTHINHDLRYLAAYEVEPPVLVDSQRSTIKGDEGR